MLRQALALACLILVLPLATRADIDPRFVVVEQRAEDLKRLQSVVVSHNGTIVYERGPVDRATNIKSLSKSVISALVGIAVDKGVLGGPGEKIAPILATSLPKERDPRLNDITVGDLLTMRSGLEGTSGRNYGSWISSANWVRDALGRSFVDEPGGRMLYSTGNTHLLSAILTKASGKTTLQLARDWLGAPLGITIPAWDRDPQGVYLGGNNMSLSPHALVKIGEMYRNGGMVGGKRVLSKSWIDASWRPVTQSFFTGHGYGYGWFETDLGGHKVHYGWGFGGQMLYVVPDIGLTVVMTSDTSDYERGTGYVQDLNALLGEAIIPAAMSGQSAVQ
jgi:CubicO group peptidase (beta-lactamase class C family)